jgi:hypothetical protein
MKKAEFKKALSSGFRVAELLSWYEIECRTCHAGVAISKRVIGDPSFGVARLLQHEYEHRERRPFIE